MGDSSVACGLCGDWIPDGADDCPKCSRTLARSVQTPSESVSPALPQPVEVAIVSSATTAGAAGGAGAGAALGFVVAGPPGAAVGYLLGLAGGTAAGIKAGKRLKKWAQGETENA